MPTTISQKLFPNKTSYFLWCIYFVAFVWWLVLEFTGSREQLGNNLYGLILGLIPLVASLYGLYLSKKWGLWKSALGKSTLFLSLGLLSWSVGTYIFAGYYNLYAQVAVPYPSWADVAYVLSWPLWGIGMFYLSRATGAKYGLKTTGGKPILLLVPVIIAAASYYLLVIVARGGGFDFSELGLKTFFDLIYPIGDVVILTLATLVYGLSFKYFGGKFKLAIYIILLGFVFNYIADFIFSYTTTLEKFYTGGWVDFIFTTALFTLSLGVTMLDPRLPEEKKRE